MTPRQFAALRALLTADLSTALRQLFLELAGWQEPEQRRFVRQVRPLVLGAQRAMAAATSAQIADRASTALGRPVAPPPVPAATREYLRQDVSVDDVYRRPFVTVYSDLAATSTRSAQPSSGRAAAAPARAEFSARPALARSGDTPERTATSSGVRDPDADVRAAVRAARERARAEKAPARSSGRATDGDAQAAVQAVRDRAATRRAQEAERDTAARLERAVAAGARRLEQIAEADMQRAHAVAASEAMQNLPPRDRPTGWKRVLVGEVNCALCVVASTQRYRIKDLNPIHPACDCAVEPLFGENERVIDPAALEAVHAAVSALTGRTDRGARAPDYRELLIGRMTPEHGELGPMLISPRHRFASKYDLPATASSSANASGDSAQATTPKGSLNDWSDDVERIAAVEQVDDRDAQLAAIWAVQGFDKPPRVVSSEEFDNLSDDHIVVYRGIAGAQAEQYAEQFRTGEAFPGLGAYGNGTYTATEREAAEGYAAGRGWRGADEDGVVVRMALPPDARTISLNDLRILQSQDPRLSEGAYGQAFGDPGRLAAALGYDALWMQPDPGEPDRYYVVLNRSKVIVEAAS